MLCNMQCYLCTLMYCNVHSYLLKHFIITTMYPDERKWKNKSVLTPSDPRTFSAMFWPVRYIKNIWGCCHSSERRVNSLGHFASDAEIRTDQGADNNINNIFIKPKINRYIKKLWKWQIGKIFYFFIQEVEIKLEMSVGISKMSLTSSCLPTKYL